MSCLATLKTRARSSSSGATQIREVSRYQPAFHHISINADTRLGRANAACLLACYMVIIQNWPPHLAIAPLAQADPPLMPFRDAGYSLADFILNIQDVVYGVWRAKEEGIMSMTRFKLGEYETYERVDYGDFNWITPYFVAFASPQHEPTQKIPGNSPEWAALPKNTAQILGSNLPSPFKCVLAHFRSKRVGLIVRLNNHLYSPSYFEALGMQHEDMVFDDGTCPDLKVVRKFIRMSHEMITKQNRAIAVHCKAGLGRTGCLIGAYLIYRHGFTANEVIAFMRFMRPGMVVGPQQHWLHLNQGMFRQWWIEEGIRDKMALSLQSSPIASPTNNKQQHAVASNGQTFTPPTPAPQSKKRRSALGELDFSERNVSGTASPYAGANNENLPAPTPGQPRKTSKLYGERWQNRTSDSENKRHASGKSGNASTLQPDTEVVTLERHNVNGNGYGHGCGSTSGLDGEVESEEEIQLRRLARKASRSPEDNGGGSKRRAVTTTSMYSHRTEEIWDRPDNDDGNGDEEMSLNEPRVPASLRMLDGPSSSSSSSSERKWRSEDDVQTLKGVTVRTPKGRAGSGHGNQNGSGALSVGKSRGVSGTQGRKASAGVRKNSGRVGSAGGLR